MTFPLCVFIKHGVGRKHKQVICEGLKGMWAVAQGCLMGAKLCVQVEEMEILVAHSFVVEVFSFLCHMLVGL